MYQGLFCDINISMSIEKKPSGRIRLGPGTIADTRDAMKHPERPVDKWKIDERQADNDISDRDVLHFSSGEAAIKFLRSLMRK